MEFPSTASAGTAGQLDLVQNVDDIRLLLGYIFVTILLILGAMFCKFIYNQFNNLF